MNVTERKVFELPYKDVIVQYVSLNTRRASPVIILKFLKMISASVQCVYKLFQILRKPLLKIKEIYCGFSYFYELGCRYFVSVAEFAANSKSDTGNICYYIIIIHQMSLCKAKFVLPKWRWKRLLGSMWTINGKVHWNTIIKLKKLKKLLKPPYLK